MTITIEIEGVKEAIAAINSLEKAGQRSVLRAALRKSVKPLVQPIRARMPEGATGRLKESAATTAKLKNKRRMRQHRRGGWVVQYLGPLAPRGLIGHLVAFGTKHAPRRQPFVGPVWDQQGYRVIAGFIREIQREVDRYIARAARRAAKRGAR